RGYSARVGGTLLFSGVRRQRVRKPLPERYSDGLDAGILKRPFGNSSPLNSVVPSCGVVVLPPAKPGFPSHGSHLRRVRWATVRPTAAQRHREASVADGGRSRLATTQLGRAESMTERRHCEMIWSDSGWHPLPDRLESMAA